MIRYAFSLGHQPHISAAEITAVFALLNISYTVALQNTSFLFIDTEAPLDVDALIQRFGGVVAILERIPVSGDLRKQDAIIETVAAYLDAVCPEGKITFSFHNGNKTGIAIKKAVKQLGRSIRFVVPKNTATVLHNNLVEKQSDLNIIDYELFVTRAIQPIEAFSKRDYDRPGADSKSGMLPPKLSRIMVNLSGVDPKNATLLDPFCGSGTVLMEAAMLGFSHIVGTDISDKAVTDTKNNIAWLKEEYPSELKQISFSYYSVDVLDLERRIDEDSVNVIVSEPYMGKALRGNEPKGAIVDQARVLGSLYENAFRQFAQVLTDGGVVVFIIPQFFYRNEWILIDCVNRIKNIGFFVEPFSDNEESLLYWRKGQHVGRAIWKFRKI
ncbi:MAG: methyltransferase domain-containing protein [Candidatus Magasanikbacteria bacterium]|nr:methyltransferase domain-containing protein [Candidatus Magasanikbacteria bacterium]NCS72155.1 methyltransferase domain-containing protein [Candidatus Magasanikbacteria bacterium]